MDLKYLLQHPDVIEENNRRRSADIDIHIVQTLAEERTKAVQRVDDVRRRIHESAETVRQASAEIRDALIAEGRALKEEARAAEETLLQMETDLERELKKYPNLLREDVKIGKDSDDNEILRLVNEPRVFDFPIQDHVAIGERLGIIDIERAGKVSGSRFVYLKGDLVLMEFALIQYILSVVIPEKFTPVLPPHIISIKSMAGMGYLEHGGEEEIYHLKHDDAVLIGTSEQSIGPMHMDEILPLESLPLRYVGFSPCYRREAGSHGKDVRGILRMHQFDKVEMFSFTTPEHSDEEHELLLSLEERLMKGLQLPYRVLRLCSGDIGRPSARTYDIETWIPSQNQYRETHSTSNTTDYQTRRLRIRYKTVDGKNELAHALNGTAFAIGRILIAILENYQQADGSVLIPEVLRPWIGKEKIG
ncbi:TPA: serine--tRNA ligase [Candidatus Uhrbacteria bacterium]|nr:serine--tRNA ligase [Candidatus Uhrbacteria bacterium]